MPSLGFCEEGLARGVDNFACADRSAAAEASSWLKKKGEDNVLAGEVAAAGGGGAKRLRPE